MLRGSCLQSPDVPVRVLVGGIGLDSVMAVVDPKNLPERGLGARLAEDGAGRIEVDAGARAKRSSQLLQNVDDILVAASVGTVRGVHIDVLLPGMILEAGVGQGI